MDEPQVSAMENKPVYRVSAAGLDPRDVRLIEIVFKHSQYNQFGFVLDAKLDPEAVDILIVNPVESEGLRAVARVRTVGRQVPVISAVPHGAPSTGRYAIAIDRLTLQLLPILNRVVELELAGGRVPASRPQQATQAPLPQAQLQSQPQPQPQPSQPVVTPPTAASSARPQAPASSMAASSSTASMSPTVPTSPTATMPPIASTSSMAPVQMPSPSLQTGTPSPSASMQFPAAPGVSGPTQAAPGTPANPLHLDLPTRDFLRRAADKSREGDQMRELAARSGRWQQDVVQAADASPPGLQWMLRKPDASLPAVPPMQGTPQPVPAAEPHVAPAPQPYGGGALRGNDSSTRGDPLRSADRARSSDTANASLPPGLADLQFPDLRLPERAQDSQGTQNRPAVPGRQGMPQVGAADLGRGADSGMEGGAGVGAGADPGVGTGAGASASAGIGTATDIGNATGFVADVNASAPGSGPSPLPTSAPPPPLPAWARDPLPAATAARQGAAAASPTSSTLAAAAGTNSGAAGAPSNLVALPLNTEVPPARIRVLVVDDSPTVRQQLARAFARMAIICDAAASAAEALQRLAERHFDLVLVDVVMPDVDGYKLTRQIRRKHRGTPVIILTSRSSPFDLARGALAGCHTYLVKPVPLKQLEAAVVKLLRKSLAIDDLTGMIRLSGDTPAATRAASASRQTDESGTPNPRSPRSAG